MAHDGHGTHLRSVPLFADLDDDEIDLVSRAATDLHIAEGTVVMREGALAHEMIVVLDGTMEVTRDGQRLGVIGPGEIAGEMAVLTRTRRTASVTATSPVQAIHLDGGQLKSVMEGAPRIALKMLPVLATRAIENSARHTD